jgi:glycerophosphoryl diester phosphodiesterase
MKDLLIVLLAFSLLAVPAAAQPLPALDLLNSKRPLVIAHRGYCQFAPENTLTSFELASTAGADLVELDYHHSKDGQMIVIHDPELDRTTDATNRWSAAHIRVDAKTAAEIQTLDAGAWFDAKFKGVKIPTLPEALATIQRSNVTLIERKAGPAADCVQLLREKQLINRVVVQAFDWEYLRAFHEQEPQQVLGALGPPNLLPGGTKPSGMPKELNAAWLDLLQKTGAKVAVWNHQVSKESVELAHKRGLKVWVYTINDPEQAQRLLDMGVDGIITNNTSLIWRAVALRAAKLS